MYNLLDKINELGRQGRDMEMIPLLEEALEMARQKKDNNLVLKLLNDYGGVLRVTGDNQKAEKLLLESQELYLSLYPRDSISYATILLNMGTNYIEMEAYEKARQVFNEAMEICEKTKDKSVVYASIANNLAVLNMKTGNYQEALSYQLKNLTSICESDGSSVKTAISIMNLADVYKAMEDYEKALLLLNFVMKFIEKKLGENHPIYSNILNNLADLYFRLGKEKEALELFEKSKDILEKTFGRQSGNYKRVVANIDYIKNSGLKEEEKPGNLTYGQRQSYDLYKNILNPIIDKKYKSYRKYMTFGLFGEGSECLGYDDQISQDHNFEPRVNIIIDRPAYQIIDSLRSDLQKIEGTNFIIQSMEEFFFNYTKFTKGPNTIEDWRHIPSHFLANATNGLVFENNLEEFTRIRKNLKDYYPEDLRIKFMALDLFEMGQAGQYNYLRANRRQDIVAASISLNIFVNKTISLVHHINKVYEPFYKWKHRSLKDLDLLGLRVSQMLEELLGLDMTSYEEKERIIEEICVLIADHLRKDNYLTTRDNFLVNCGFNILDKVEDETLRKESIWSIQ